MTQPSDNEPGDRQKQRAVRWRQVRLSTIVLLILVFALAFGWWADHARLMKLIDRQTKVVNVYALQYYDASRAIAPIKGLFPELNVASDARTNSIIARGPQHELKQLEAYLQVIEAAKR